MLRRTDDVFLLLLYFFFFFVESYENWKHNKTSGRMTLFFLLNGKTLLWHFFLPVNCRWIAFCCSYLILQFSIFFSSSSAHCVLCASLFGLWQNRWSIRLCRKNCVAVGINFSHSGVNHNLNGLWLWSDEPNQIMRGIVRWPISSVFFLFLLICCCCCYCCCFRNVVI